MRRNTFVSSAICAALLAVAGHPGAQPKSPTGPAPHTAAASAAGSNKMHTGNTGPGTPGSNTAAPDPGASGAPGSNKMHTGNTDPGTPGTGTTDPGTGHSGTSEQGPSKSSGNNGISR